MAEEELDYSGNDSDNLVGQIPRATLQQKAGKEEGKEERPQSFMEELTETIKDRKVSSTSSELSEKSSKGYE